MNYEITIEGGGDIIIYKDLPEALSRLTKLAASSYTLTGDWGKANFLHYTGKGFTISFNEYHMVRDTIMKARSPEAIIELHVALGHPLKGTWDGIIQPSLARRQFNLRHTSYVQTRVIFDPNKLYGSFDIYFEKPYLIALASDFPLLAQFLEKVERKDPASLSAFNYYCNKPMLTAIKFIENNVYSTNSQKWLVENKVKEILLAALDVVAEIPPGKEIKIYPHEEEALYALKGFIAEQLDITPSLEEFCRQCAMSENRLTKGFKQLFGATPHEYHITIRMEEAKRLLLNTDEAINKIAYKVGYHHVSNFCLEFRRATGLQPGVYRQAGRKRKS